MLQPVGDKVMLEIVTQLDELKARTTLLLGDDIRQGEPDRGRVLAIGPAVDSAEYDVGDLVAFHTREVFEGIKYEGQDLVFIRHHEIMGTIEEDS